MKEGAEAKIPASSTGAVVSMQDVKALASSRTGTTRMRPTKYKNPKP